MLFNALAPEAGHIQKALVKKKLIYFNKTIPKFSESERQKTTTKKTKPNQNKNTPFSPKGETIGKTQTNK